MSKIVFTADIHFGVPGRLDDILFACKVIREYCKTTGIDTVVVLGDMFHDRKALVIDVLVAVTQFLTETSDKYGQQWITFPGNHDMFLRHSWQINSLMPLEKHLTVINDVKILQLDQQRFWVLPFIQYEVAYMRVLAKIRRQVETGDKLLTHIGVNGATLNTCFLLKDWSIVNFNNQLFDKVYTGHFHSKQQIGENVWYPGSPIPFKFDEGDIPHGFYVYDTDEDLHKFVNIWKAAAKFFPEETPPPQFCTLLEEQISNLTQDDINNNIVRVALSRESSNNEKTDIKQHLLDLGARTVRFMNTSCQTEPKEIIASSYAEGRNLFMSWVDADEKGIKDLDKKLLLSLNDEVILEGDEIYTEEGESQF